jgi:hypothetical protein
MLTESGWIVGWSAAGELEGGVTGRSIRNRVAAKTFPEPDAYLDGIPRWLRATYAKYCDDVLAGKFRGRARAQHLRNSKPVTPAAA